VIIFGCLALEQSSTLDHYAVNVYRPILLKICTVPLAAAW